MVQLVKELLVKALQTDMMLIKADQIKFLTVIDPLKTPTFEVNLHFDWVDGKELKVSGAFSNGETVYFKLQGALFVSSQGAK
jgi:3-hydroxyacyl-[acyl-carrier-protein] dehydratase